MTKQDNMLDAKEMARFLKCSRKTIYRMVEAGMPSERLRPSGRGRLRFNRVRVCLWMAKQAKKLGQVGTS